MEKKEIHITDRDTAIMHLINDFRFCLGRHIKILANFSSLRVCDRRLKRLVEAGYLARKKYLYGVPYLYTLTHKGKMYLGENKRLEKIRIDRINHDVAVLDVLVFYNKGHGISLNNIISERTLHSQAGFGARKHCPDFVIIDGEEKHAVEIEITPKEKSRLDKNVQDNYLKYNRQIWFTDNNKVRSMIEHQKEKFLDVELRSMSEVKHYVANLME